MKFNSLVLLEFYGRVDEALKKREFSMKAFHGFVVVDIMVVQLHGAVRKGSSG